MDSAGTEDEFKSLLRAHVKKIGMKIFLSGDQIERAQSDTDYKMTFEKGNKKRGKRNKYELDKEMKWFLE
jgi:uncharacterized protein (DUF169 family)